MYFNIELYGFGSSDPAMGSDAFITTDAMGEWKLHLYFKHPEIEKSVHETEMIASFYDIFFIMCNPHLRETIGVSVNGLMHIKVFRAMDITTNMYDRFDDHRQILYGNIMPSTSLNTYVVISFGGHFEEYKTQRYNFSIELEGYDKRYAINFSEEKHITWGFIILRSYKDRLPIFIDFNPETYEVLDVKLVE